MTELYAAVDDDLRVRALFSTLDKAIGAVEARFDKEMRRGYYGDQYRHGPLPVLVWESKSPESHVPRFLRDGQWRHCLWDIETIALDPEEIE